MGNPAVYQPGGFYFSGFRKVQDVQIFSGAPFATNAVPEKIEHEPTRGRGQENKNYTESICSIFANFQPLFVFWALFLKIQSPIIPSISGVRGSSPDSRNLSPIPFNYTPLAK